MNDDDLDLLVRRTLERDAASQPVAADLHRRSVAYGRHLRRRRQAGAASAVAALVAVAAVASVVLSGHAKKAEPTVRPTPTLSSIATHVAGLGDEGQKTSPWWYERITVQTAARTDVAEMWQSRQGVTKTLLDGSSTKVAIQGNATGDVDPSASWATFSHFVTDPAALYEQTKSTVLSDVGSDVAPAALDGDIFGRLAPLLERGEFPPVDRAVILRALAMVPGVQLRGMAADTTGRLGLVVDPVSAGFSVGKRYLIDPKTGLVIELQALDGQGTVTSRTTFAVTARVADSRSLPAGVTAVTPFAPAPLPSGQQVLLVP
jgi:hypothetical protein